MLSPSVQQYIPVYVANQNGKSSVNFFWHIVSEGSVSAFHGPTFSMSFFFFFFLFLPLCVKFQQIVMQNSFVSQCDWGDSCSA